MAIYNRFEELPVWKQAKALAVSVYKLSDKGKLSRDFSLRDQIRCCAVSVSSNIAEGFERGSKQELIQFLYIARGSCGELRSQLYIAKDTGYIEPATFKEIYEQADKVSGQINGFIEYLKNNKKPGQKYQ